MLVSADAPEKIKFVTETLKGLVFIDKDHLKHAFSKT